ncbi:YeeE/YedE family protein [Thalassotalea sp. 1_MG-2023]|uniref:YeeE/YedE family protein n=1 Tax=Thalassotalea sp. 1_MG-2023 TaxID=3062680 RepID=UPI0026E1BAB7|nr:YeeE/YedE family protein [Thalassotalea sp. 1_MG-2023]MDO6428756.1 YeeE/YedE family protein [Thalassotalea sp. 1_MG-2023]
MKIVLVSLFSGFIFGIGLIISGMSNPARVLNFLDLSARWDPTLALVMGGAIAVTMPSFYWIRKRNKPLFADKFEIPSNNNIDRKLVIGACIFGIGWGIAGLCPGPSIVAITTLQPEVLLFVFSMLLGILAQHGLHVKTDV